MRTWLLCIAFALMLLAPASALADGGDIVGTVYLDDQPGSGLCVDVFDNAGNDVASQLTNGGGDYNIYVSQPGSYTVRFGDCGAGYVTTQWYPNAQRMDDAGAVVVVGDAITPQINGYLSSAGRITGHLVDTLNAVLTGACVKAEQNGYVVGETKSDGNGNYELGGLPPGDARVFLQGCSAGNYVPEYYDDARSPLAAKTVAVVAGDSVNGIDAVLTPGGRITGHVQDANGAPVQNICVAAGVDGGDAGSAWTDAGGNYEIRGVPPTGTYTISASGCTDTSWVAAYANGPLVAPPGTTVVDFTLWHPAYVTGHVSGDGSPLPSICISAKNTTSGEEFHDQTASNGYYELNWIQPGTYDLTFSDCHSTGDWATATTTAVVLGDGQTLMDVDKALEHRPADPGGGAGGGGSDPSAGGGDPGAGSAGGSGQPGAASEAPASGPSADGASAEDPQATGSGDHPGTASRACKVPRLLGLSLAKAKQRLAKAGCALGKVTKRHGRAKRGRVLRQKTTRGAAKPAGFKVAVTVAR